MTNRQTLTKAEVAQYTGTEQGYRHPMVRDVLYTDGARHVAEAGGAYWLLDEIAFAQRSESAVATEEFQVWKFSVREDRTAKLSCEDGNTREVYVKDLEYTDFPLAQISLYYSNRTILLPSEW